MHVKFNAYSLECKPLHSWNLLHGRLVLKPLFFIVLILLLAGPLSSTAQISNKRYLNQKSVGGFISAGFPYYNLNFTFRHKFNVVEAVLTAGIRHISNLGFEDPNIGVETILIGFTLAKTFN